MSLLQPSACEFPRTPPWVCTRCGREAKVQSTKPPLRRCAPQKPVEARSEAEQTACKAVCLACAEYLPADDGCKKCGCASSRREALASKRRVGDCPLKKWPASSSPSSSTSTSGSVNIAKDSDCPPSGSFTVPLSVNGSGTVAVTIS